MCIRDRYCTLKCPHNIPALMETQVQEYFAILEDCYLYLSPGSVYNAESDACKRSYNNLNNEEAMNEKSFH